MRSATEGTAAFAAAFALPRSAFGLAAKSPAPYVEDLFKPPPNAAHIVVLTLSVKLQHRKIRAPFAQYEISTAYLVSDGRNFQPI
mmetsp:Transcript_60795/g.144857  ORF Transcript_60795/g.144857 Transcript_60795/m.144857 type:complete len:85 (+) Transcript_60795:1427-1681(+)